MSPYALDDAGRLLLFDPESARELLELATDREPVVVLTAPWHGHVATRSSTSAAFEMNGWLRGGVTREQVVERLSRSLRCRSISCYRRMEHRQTAPRSSAHSPDGGGR
jgi:hypothetical protein